jgi:hypothetical protein
VNAIKNHTHAYNRMESMITITIKSQNHVYKIPLRIWGWVLLNTTKLVCKIRIISTYKYIFMSSLNKCGSLNTHHHAQHYWVWCANINGRYPEMINSVTILNFYIEFNSTFKTDLYGEDLPQLINISSGHLSTGIWKSMSHID